MRFASLAPKTSILIQKRVFRVTSRIPLDGGKDISNDDNGKHTHLANQSCILANCDTKKCVFKTV